MSALLTYPGLSCRAEAHLLRIMYGLWECGDVDRVSGDRPRLYPLTVAGEPMTAMVYTDGASDLALVVVMSDARRGHRRHLLLDGGGLHGPRGEVWMHDGHRAVPGVAKYRQAVADVMAVRLDKRPVARAAARRSA